MTRNYSPGSGYLRMENAPTFPSAFRRQGRTMRPYCSAALRGLNPFAWITAEEAAVLVLLTEPIQPVLRLEIVASQ